MASGCRSACRTSCRPGLAASRHRPSAIHASAPRAMGGSAGWEAPSRRVAAERRPPRSGEAGEVGRRPARPPDSLIGELVERDHLVRLPDSTFAGDEEYVFKYRIRERGSAGALLRSPRRCANTTTAIADRLASSGERRGEAKKHFEMLRDTESERAPGPRRGVVRRGGGRRRRACAGHERQRRSGFPVRCGLELLAGSRPSRRRTPPHARAHHVGDVLQSL